jgi:hypothetical protein
MRYNKYLDVVAVESVEKKPSRDFEDMEVPTYLISLPLPILISIKVKQAAPSI